MKTKHITASRPSTVAPAMAHHFLSSSSVSKKMTKAENAVMSRPEHRHW